MCLWVRCVGWVCLCVLGVCALCVSALTPTAVILFNAKNPVIAEFARFLQVRIPLP